MQFYHHPISMDSQKVRLALEEKGIDYTSYHVNPLTGKKMDASFFRMSPSSKLPVLRNGSHAIFEPMNIILYIDKLVISLDGKTSSITSEVMDWMLKIEEWNPKIFTLSHAPSKYRVFVSKFIRRVVIARMSESPDLASMYHTKLRDAYEFEEKLRNPELLKQSEETLIKLLDGAERKLQETPYLAGEEFTLADAMFVPVLARLTLLNLEKEYIICRPSIAEFYELVKLRPSYKRVIGNHFTGWRKHRTLLRTALFLCFRSLFRRY